MKKSTVAISLIMALALTACGSTAKAESVKNTETVSVTITESEEESADSSETESALETEADSEADSEAVSDMFTDRDMSAEYDESSSVKITLNGSSASCADSGVTIDGSTVTITAEGTYLISGTLEDGMIIVDADEAAKVQLVLDGANINSDSSAAIYVKSADKVFLTLADGSENTLSNGGSFTAIDENNIDAAVFSKEDITVNGSGSLIVNSPAGHGMVSKDDLKVTGGELTISAAGHGLSGKDSVRIADGDISITAGNDGIHAENEEDTEKGYIYICGGNIIIDSEDDALHSSLDVTIDGGSITASADDDGIHADNTVIVNDGVIDVENSYEGIEGLCIEINGGQIDVTASDDGLNAAGGNDGSGDAMFGMMGDISADSYLKITGGTLTVDSSGDGLDSNGTLEMTGGTVYVSGPTNSGNGALDYGMEAKISGGTIIAAGASGMAENFTSVDQGTILLTVDTQNGGEISLTDSSGNVLASWTAEKAYNSVLISCPEIKEGESYTLTAGSYSETITMDSLIYGSGMGMGGMPGGMQGGQMPGGMQGGPRR